MSLCAVLGATVLTLVCGCGGGSSSGSADDFTTGLPPEGVAVFEAFKDASPSYKFPVEDALRLVRAGGENPRLYAEALPALQRLASNPTVTPEQKQALEALVVKLKSDLATMRR